VRSNKTTAHVRSNKTTAHVRSTKQCRLLVFAVMVAGTFWVAGDRQRRRKLPGLMAHSLIQIVIGFVFAPSRPISSSSASSPSSCSPAPWAGAGICSDSATPEVAY
jgi:hypothetical protein